MAPIFRESLASTGHTLKCPRRMEHRGRFAPTGVGTIPRSDKSALVLAEGIRDAYQDLFKVNTKAYELTKTEVGNKLKTLSQGQLTDSVLDKMGMTFAALVKQADFSGPTPVVAESVLCEFN